ncbi:MAG: hypothetical protein CM15mV11_0020 [Caudoviricetes sp.]|nr:MAG: hypothetical protein CM15mV11_0020 [Caudoviricetes sp.]
MRNLREDILKSQINYYNGLIAKHQQNVEIYLNQPVGIGNIPMSWQRLRVRSTILRKHMNVSKLLTIIL